MSAKVGIIMGSRSDWETMQHSSETLDALGISHETQIVSAHRTPDWLFEYAASAAERGLQVIIAGAGGAAHLPGMTASKTLLPVLGVPIQSKALQGMDSLLSIVQMPAGVPVGSMAIGKPGAINIRHCPHAGARPYNGHDVLLPPALPCFACLLLLFRHDSQCLADDTVQDNVATIVKTADVVRDQYGWH